MRRERAGTGAAGWLQLTWLLTGHGLTSARITPPRWAVHGGQAELGVKMSLGKHEGGGKVVFYFLVVFLATQVYSDWQ